MRGPHKERSLQILRERGIPFGSVLDVGILRGTPELRKIFSDLPQVLFEPVAEFAADIRKQYAGLDFKLVGAAVSDREGEVTLEVFTIFETVKISHSRIVDAEADGARKRTVPSVTLDGYLQREPSPPPYFLKIDVDGLELPILRGATETLKRASVVMVETPKSQFSSRIAYLEERGFELYDLVEPCYYDDSFWQCDAIMINKQVQRQHFADLLTGFRREFYSKFR